MLPPILGMKDSTVFMEVLRAHGHGKAGSQHAEQIAAAIRFDMAKGCLKFEEGKFCMP